MQRTLKIFINDLFYKDITVEADNKGDYEVGPIFSMLGKEKDEGRLIAFIPPSGQFSIRMQLRR